MIKPLFDRLYIIPLADKEMTQSGLLYIPETARQRVDQGIVKYRGPQTTGEIKVGDHVLFSGYDGSEIITEDDGTLYVMPEDFIQAILNDDIKMYLFTEAQINAFISKALGDSKLKWGTPNPDLDYMAEKLRTLIDSHFYSELHF